MNLNLLTIRFPVTAIVSILHRVTGAFLFLLVPFLIWVFQYSLTEPGFDALQGLFSYFLFKFFVWLLFIPLSYHLVAGIRHLLMDIEIGVTLKAGKQSAMLTFVFSGVLIILAGIWLW